MSFFTYSALDSRLSIVGYRQYSSGAHQWTNSAAPNNYLLFDFYGTDLQFLNYTTSGSAMQIWIDGALKYTVDGTVGTNTNGTTSFINGEFHSGSTLTPFTNATPGTLLTDTWHQCAIINGSNNYTDTVSFAVVSGSAQAGGNIRASTICNYLPPGAAAQNGTQYGCSTGTAAKPGIMMEPTQLWNFADIGLNGFNTFSIPVVGGKFVNTATIPNAHGNGQSLRFRTPIGTTSVGYFGNIDLDSNSQGMVLFIDKVRQGLYKPTYNDGLKKLITGTAETDNTKGDYFHICDLPNDGQQHIIDLQFMSGTSIGFIATAGGVGGIDTTWSDPRTAIYCFGDSETNGDKGGGLPYHNYWPNRLYDALGTRYVVINGGWSGTTVDVAADSSNISGVNRAAGVASLVQASQSSGTRIAHVFVGYGTNDWADPANNIRAALGGGSPTDAQFNTRYQSQYQTMVQGLISGVDTSVKFWFAPPAPRVGLDQYGGLRASSVGPNMPRTTIGHSQYVTNTSTAVAAAITATGATNVFFVDPEMYGDLTPVVCTIDGSGNYQDTRGDLNADGLHYYQDSGSIRYATRAGYMMGLSTYVAPSSHRDLMLLGVG